MNYAHSYLDKTKIAKELRHVQLIRKLKNCLANFSLPVMIHSQDEKILYPNRNWLEITGYNTADISDLKEWRQKAKIKQHGSKKSYLSSIK